MTPFLKKFLVWFTSFQPFGSFILAKVPGFLIINMTGLRIENYFIDIECSFPGNTVIVYILLNCIRVAIQDITTALNRMQAVYEIPISWAGIGTAQVDCGALLDPATKYALVCTTWDSVTGDGATKVRLSVGRVTGFTAGADRDQLYRSDEMTYAANVAGQTDPVNGIRPFLSDATGHVWLYIETTGGTSTGEGSIFVKKTL